MLRSSLITALLLASCARAAAVQITLKPGAQVPGPRVTLAELALIEGDHSQAGRVDLGPAPLPGYTLRLSRAEIARMLRARGVLAQPGGAAAVAVERATGPADASAVLALAEQSLRQRWPQRLELALAAPLQEFALPPGQVRYQVRAAPQANVQRRVTVWMDVLVDGRFVRTVAPVFEVKAFGPALVATRAMPAGARLDCTALELRDIDLAQLAGPAAAPACGAARLKRTLAQGATLLAADVQAEQAVAQGDSVGLRLQEGAIVIEARAIALSGGDVGQRIEVTPAGALRPVRADIVGPGLVILTGK